MLYFLHLHLIYLIILVTHYFADSDYSVLKGYGYGNTYANAGEWKLPVGVECGKSNMWGTEN